MHDTKLLYYTGVCYENCVVCYEIKHDLQFNDEDHSHALQEHST